VAGFYSACEASGKNIRQKFGSVKYFVARNRERKFNFLRQFKLIPQGA